jgi:predicted MPP superfamily phosphohydrolase
LRSRLSLVALFLLLDAYAFQALRVLLEGRPGFWPAAVAYWAFTAAVLVGIGVSMVVDRHRWPAALLRYFPPVFVILFLAKLLVAVFLLADDCVRVARYMGGNPDPDRLHAFSLAGVITAGVPAVLLLWGMVANVYRYQVRRQTLRLRRTPDAHRGLRIVQLSDIHAGSLGRPHRVARAIDIVNGLEPDLILFTGDLVNLVAEEAEPFVELFARLRAKHGVWAVTGNHDYGDYVAWESPQQKAANFERFLALFPRMGWRLLRNEHALLDIGGVPLALIGVENWSAHGRFSRYGDLQRAYGEAAFAPTQILLSHDPSHWKAEVLPRYPEIDLQLAGHTHGFQFGLEIGNWRWSPGQYVYREWAGFYEEAGRFLYVNRGFGYTFYPGRVGMRPEITLIELA